MSKRLSHPVLENYKNGLMVTYPQSDKREDIGREGIFFEGVSGGYDVVKVSLDEERELRKDSFDKTGGYIEYGKEFFNLKYLDTEPERERLRRFIVKTAMKKIIRAANYPCSEMEFLDRRNGKEKLVKLRNPSQLYLKFS